MTLDDPVEIRRFLARNRKQFRRYTAFRRQMFTELAPREAEAILYLLPWLLSVNHPACPGYIRELRYPFRLDGIEQDQEIKQREADFKARFGIVEKGSLVKPTHRRFYLQGLYTIGSIGTSSQNSKSDCDLWLCFDKETFSQNGWRHLNCKVNLIKDWLDETLKMPIFFFVADTDAIRCGKFGAVDSESSGSTQQHILKEEFYRTCIVISGRIPLWWLCWHNDRKVDYQAMNRAIAGDVEGVDDVVDLGDITHIERHEYFGAALWQFQKALLSPLKSILKMILLQMQLASPSEELICHRLRDAVYRCSPRSFSPIRVCLP
jgi:adenylate cyclase class 1